MEAEATRLGRRVLDVFACAVENALIESINR